MRPRSRIRLIAGVSYTIGMPRQDRGQSLDTAIGDTESAAGEMRVAAPLLQGSGFEDEHAGAVLMGRDRGAKRGVAGSHHEHVRPLAREIDRWHDFPGGPF